MKKRMHALLKRSPRKSMASFALLLFICSFAISSNAQTWTYRYGNGSSGVYDLSPSDRENEFVLQAFHYDNGCDIGLADGRVIDFRRVFHIAGGVSALQVSLIDNGGQEIHLTGGPIDLIYDPAGMELIPKAAAFNSNTNEYIVCGYAETTPGRMGIWYVLFDLNLQPIPFTTAGTDYLRTVEDAGTTPSPENLYVTDVCAVTANPGFDFAFVGKRDANYSIDLWRNMATFGSSELFVMELTAATGATSFANVTWAGSDKMIPNKIIELPVPPPNAGNGGYFVAGTNWGTAFGVTPNPYNTPTNVAANTSFFYLRCGYNVSTTTQFAGRQYNSSGNLAKLNAQALQYDPLGNGTIYVAGNGLTEVGASEEGIIFFDRIDNVNTTTPANFTNLSATFNTIPNTPAIPYVFNQSADYIMRFAYAEGVFDNLQGGVVSEKHIVGRCLEDVALNTGNMPFEIDIDYNNLVYNTWPTSGIKNGTMYNRLAPSPSTPNFHTHGEHLYYLSTVNYNQIVKQMNATAGNEEYFFGTVADGQTTVAASRADLGFTNDCTTIPGIFRPVNLDLSVGANPSALIGRTTNIAAIIPTLDADNSLTEQCNPITNPFVYEPGPTDITFWATAGTVHWQGDVSTLSKVELIDLSGAVIRTVAGAELYYYSINMADLAQGIYIVRANYSDAKHTPDVLKVSNH